MSIEQALSDKDPVKEVGFKSFMNLVNQGHLNCAWVEYRSIYLTYLSFKAQDSRTAATRTAEHYQKAISSIYLIIHRFE